MSDLEAKDAAPVTRSFPQDEYAVEIATENNGQVLWPMTQEKLRGRWSRNVLIGHRAAPALAQMPNIPGLYVAVDLRTRKARIVDPLTFPENAALLRDIKHRHKEFTNGNEGRPEETREYDFSPANEQLTELERDTQLKSWVYWMKRLVDAGHAVPVRGQLPTLKDIASFPGRTLIEPFNVSATDWKYREPPTDAEKKELLLARGVLS